MINTVEEEGQTRARMDETLKTFGITQSRSGPIHLKLTLTDTRRLIEILEEGPWRKGEWRDEA